MFCGCSSLFSLPNIHKWNKKEVTNMKYMFTGCSLLPNLLDISKSNTGNLTNNELHIRQMLLIKITIRYIEMECK